MNINIFKNYTYALYIYLIVGIIILSTLCFILTRKYNWRIKNFYSIFFDLSIRELLVYACMFLNIIYVAYFSICDSTAALYGICLIILNSLISIIFCWNFKIIVQEIINIISMTASIYLLSLVKDYLNIIMFDKTIYILEIILIILNIIFSAIKAFRNMEVVLKSNVERKKNNGRKISKEKAQEQ